MPGVRFAAGLGVLLAVLAGAAMAEPDRTGWRLLGQGWLLSNDAIGDGHDRWRSVGLSYGAVTGPGWAGRLPDRPGEILEFRLMAEAIAPSNLVDPDPAERRYAGIVSAGMHSHFAPGRAEVRLGADLVAVGPRTGVAGLHEAMHDLFGLSPIRPGVHRLDNALHPTLSAEVGLSWPLGPATALRPFAEVRLGDEDLARIGADLMLGAADQRALWLRDPITGQRHVGVRGQAGPGLYATFGADIAAVRESAWLPAGGAAVLRDRRARLRAGIGYRARRSDGFAGLTWLSEEFEGQGAPQVVGSVTLRFRF